jgi:hypothetical protein
MVFCILFQIIKKQTWKHLAKSNRQHTNKNQKEINQSLTCGIDLEISK